MTVFRCILPQWRFDELAKAGQKPLRILEGQFSDERLMELNEEFYNIHYLPNYPREYTKGRPVDGRDVDTWEYVYVDMDLKEGVYPDKEAFLNVVMSFSLEPSRIIDSGNGIHAYWRVSDLDAKSFLRIQRRLCRDLKTDEAVAKIYQLMRPAGFVNTKNPEDLKPVELLHETDLVYTCEDLDKALSPITEEDEQYCVDHYNKTYDIGEVISVVDKIPAKFERLIKSNAEVKEIWIGGVDDRSKADYRLGHIMMASGFTKDEAMSVLINSAKALDRAPRHRIAYAQNIVEKIWTFEESSNKLDLDLSESVLEILTKSGGAPAGERLPCWRYFDDTEHGFRRGHVIGLVAGSKVGKSAVAIDMFRGFAQNNPDLHHFFIPLEQPKREIADRWKLACGEDTYLYNKVHVLSNYGDNGEFRHLSLEEIRTYLEKWQKVTGNKIGCVVIDHIGVLKKNSKDGRQSIEDICHHMKAFAIQLDVLLVMQSQAPREKAGIGDLELNKDAAYGTVFFESYCDYLITLWQPLKRQYGAPGCPTVTAYKFCAIRHKKQTKDKIQEDLCYRLFFDPETARFRELTQNEEVAFDFHNSNATNKRKKDRKTDLVPYVSIRTKEPFDDDGKINSHKNN